MQLPSFDTGRYGTVAWFGNSWGSAVCEPATHVPTPVGDECAGGCGEPIRQGDAGVGIPFVERGTVTYLAQHRLCFLRSVLGDDLAEMLERRVTLHAGTCN